MPRALTEGPHVLQEPGLQHSGGTAADPGDQPGPDPYSGHRGQQRGSTGDREVYNTINANVRDPIRTGEPGSNANAIPRPTPSVPASVLPPRSESSRRRTPPRWYQARQGGTRWPRSVR